MRVISDAAIELVAGKLYRLGDTVELRGDISWLTPDVRGYQPFNCYLVREPQMSTLIDTGFAMIRATMLRQLASVHPSGLPLAVFLTRSEYESAGNLGAVRDAVGVQSLWAGEGSSLDGFSDLKVFGTLLDNVVQRAGHGMSLVGSERVEIIGPPIKALNSQSWLYDREAKALFTSDAFGYATVDGPDASPIEAPNDATTYDHAKRQTLRRFPWITDAHTEDVKEALRRIFEERDIEILAPMHGCIVMGRHAVRRHYDFLQRILSDARPPALDSIRRATPSQHAPISGRASYPPVVPGKPREIAPGIDWLAVCSPSGSLGSSAPVHVYSSAHIVKGGSRTLMVDTGRPSKWADMERQIETSLKGRPLDWLFPTHPEVPHCGNLPRILDKYPNAKAIGDLGSYHLYFPEYASRFVSVAPGHSIDLGGGSRFLFLEALMKDHQSTLWAYEPKRQVLFTSDGFVHTHQAAGTAKAGEAQDPTHTPDQCQMMTSELHSTIDIEVASMFYRSVFYSCRFVDRDLVFRRFDELLAAHPTRLLASSHGSVSDTLEEMVPVFQSIYDRTAAMQGEVTKVRGADGGYKSVLR